MKTICEYCGVDVDECVTKYCEAIGGTKDDSHSWVDDSEISAKRRKRIDEYLSRVAASEARSKRQDQQRALEAAVVDAAMVWAETPPPPSAGSKLFDACAALRAFRERESGR